MKSIVKKGKELALDDKEMRKLNTQKIIDCVEEITDIVKSGKRYIKIHKMFLWVMIGLILFLFVGSMIAVANKSGGFSRFFDNLYSTENVNKRIVCTNHQDTMIFRTPQEAYYFLEVFGNNSYCQLIDKLEDSK